MHYNITSVVLIGESPKSGYAAFILNPICHTLDFLCLALHASLKKGGKMDI